MRQINQKGIAPILLLVAVVGILAFLAISSSAPFKNNLLSSLFPKEVSKAAEAIPSPFPNCQPLGGIVPEGQATPPYNPATQIGGLEAEPQGPIWCFPLSQMPTTRVKGDNDWVDEFNTGIQMGRLNDGDMDYRVSARAHGGNIKGQAFINANHWMTDFALTPTVGGDMRPSGAIMLSPNKSFKAENGTLVIETDVAFGTDAMGGADNFIEIDISPQDFPDADRDYYGYGSFSHGALGCRIEKGSGSMAIVCSQFSPWPVIPLPITETPAGNCAHLPDINGDIYNCLSGHSTPDSTGDGHGNRLWETQGIGCAWMGGCKVDYNNLKTYARTCLDNQMDYFCRDRIRMEVTKTMVTIYVNGGKIAEYGPFPSVIPAESTTAPGYDGRIPDTILNNAHVFFTHWINDSSERAFVSRAHWDRIAVNPHDLPGHPQPPTSAPSYCTNQPNHTCPIITQVTNSTGINVPASNTVEMLDFVYNQQVTNITAGSTITFVNKGTQPHSATADDGSWDTGILSAGQSKTITFNTTGASSFHCVPHPTMTGTINVYANNGSPLPSSSTTPLPSITPMPSMSSMPSPSASSTPGVGQIFNTNLSGTQNVPVITTNGTGTAVLTLSPDQTSASVALTFNNLTSAAISAHIHGPAAVGVNAGILYNLNIGAPGVTTTTTITGLTGQQIADLKNGLWYVNVHSTNFTGGEIRGQFQSYILGRNIQGSKLDANDSNFLNASRFTSSSAGILNSISAFVGAIAAAPNNQYQLAIYSDNNGVPGNLIANSVSGTLTANSWNTLPVTANLSANTSYWLVYNTNGNSQQINNLYQDTNITGNLTVFKAQTFGTWPSSFGASQTTHPNVVFSIYGNVSLSGAPAPSASSANKPGDADGNNKVDIFDYNILLTNFGKTGSGIQGDFDNNGKVDIFDFNTLLSNFGK